MFTLSCELLVEEQGIAHLDDNMSVAGEEDPGAALDTVDLSPTIAFGLHDRGKVALVPGSPLGSNRAILSAALHG